jgi:hypothetical protein
MIMIKIREEENRFCDVLDLGLEALLFFGCALDRAGVFCVRLLWRMRACVCV